MKAFHNKTIQFISILLCAWALTGCGASRGPGLSGGSTDLGSRVEDPSDTINGSVAHCNQFSISNEGLTAQLSTHYSGGSLVLDYINLNISNVPSALTSAGGHYLQIFRWSEDNPGQRITNNEPVKMFFIQRNTGKVLGEQEPVSAISKGVIEDTITKYNLTGGGTTVSNFLDRHVIVMKGMDITYDAIIVGLYDQTNKAYAWANALLPAFLANPNKYAAEHPAISLQQLHPLYDRRNSGMTDEAFLAETNKFCQAAL